jgi:hypothetical protein
VTSKYIHTSRIIPEVELAAAALCVLMAASLLLSGCSGFKGITWGLTPYASYRIPEGGGANNDLTLGASFTIWERDQTPPAPAVPSYFRVEQDVNVVGGGASAEAVGGAASSNASQQQEQAQGQGQAQAQAQAQGRTQNGNSGHGRK